MVTLKVSILTPACWISKEARCSSCCGQVYERVSVRGLEPCVEFSGRHGCIKAVFFYGDLLVFVELDFKLGGFGFVLGVDEVFFVWVVGVNFGRDEVAVVTPGRPDKGPTPGHYLSKNPSTPEP